MSLKTNQKLKNAIEKLNKIRKESSQSLDLDHSEDKLKDSQRDKSTPLDQTGSFIQEEQDITVNKILQGEGENTPEAEDEESTEKQNYNTHNDPKVSLFSKDRDIYIQKYLTNFNTKDISIEDQQEKKVNKPKNLKEIIQPIIDDPSLVDYKRPNFVLKPTTNRSIQDDKSVKYSSKDPLVSLGKMEKIVIKQVIDYEVMLNGYKSPIRYLVDGYKKTGVAYRLFRCKEESDFCDRTCFQ